MKLHRNLSDIKKIIQKRKFRRAVSGYVLISPWIVGFSVFVLGPILSSGVLSFTRYNLFSPPVFVGLENYTYILTKDPLFWGSVQRTVFFALTIVVIGLSCSLFFAILLNQGYRGTTFFRTAFFIPSLTPLVAVALLWRWILSPRLGIVNGLLSSIGITGPGWYLEFAWALPSVMLVWLWWNVGGQSMIIFLAGLQNVPQELYDAAQVDGANSWERFVNITLPMISPTFFFNIVVGIIGGLRVFGLPFVLTAVGDVIGGPSYATHFFIIHLYDTAFRSFEMGTASALAWLFFIAVLLLTILQFIAARRWVYYPAEE